MAGIWERCRQASPCGVLCATGSLPCGVGVLLLSGCSKALVTWRNGRVPKYVGSGWLRGSCRDWMSHSTQKQENLVPTRRCHLARSARTVLQRCSWFATSTRCFTPREAALGTYTNPRSAQAPKPLGSPATSARPSAQQPRQVQSHPPTTPRRNLSPKPLEELKKKKKREKLVNSEGL